MVLSERLMTVTDAAAYLEVDRSVVMHAIGRGRLVSAGRVGRMHLLDRDDVEAYKLTRGPGPPRGPKRPQ